MVQLANCLSNAWIVGGPLYLTNFYRGSRAPNSGSCESVTSILFTELSPKFLSFFIFKVNEKVLLSIPSVDFSIQSVLKQLLYPPTKLKWWEHKEIFQHAHFLTPSCHSHGCCSSLLFLQRGVNRGKFNIPLPILFRG